jgi:iron complex outermembrane receptor protein
MPLALPGQLGIHDSHLDTRYYSLFGQVAIPFGERFELTGTARWQSEEKNGSINNSVTQPGASVISVVFTPATSPTGAPVNGSLRRTTDYFTWSLTPRYQFNDDLMSYLTVSRGGKSGGFNTGFGNAPLTAREFDDETIDHLEIGMRATLANGRLRLSGAAFSTTYHDYQDAAFISAQFAVGNAERVELKGMEFEGRAVIGGRLTADLAISFADLIYATNTTGLCSPGRVPDGTLLRSCDMSGEHPIDAPQWVINAGLQHIQPMSWGELSLRLNASWTDRYNTSFSADPRLVQDAHFDVGLRLSATLGGRYEFVLWGDNLLNENVAYIDSLLNLFDDASYQSYFAEPRSYGLTLRMRF